MFFKCKIAFIHIFFLQLILSLFILHWPESTFHYHNNLDYVLQKFFFSIESNRFNNKTTKTQYLYLQLDSFSKIGVKRINFVILILLLSGDISLSPGQIQNNQI